MWVTHPQTKHLSAGPSSLCPVPGVPSSKTLLLCRVWLHICFAFELTPKIFSGHVKPLRTEESSLWELLLVWVFLSKCTGISKRNIPLLSGKPSFDSYPCAYTYSSPCQQVPGYRKTAATLWPRSQSQLLAIQWLKNAPVLEGNKRFGNYTAKWHSKMPLFKYIYICVCVYFILTSSASAHRVPVIMFNVVELISQLFRQREFS